MTPAERVVVEAARRWVNGRPEDSMRLVAAVGALEAEGRPAEEEITWDQVVEGDQIQVGGKWFEVLEAKPGAVRAKSEHGLVGNFKSRTGPLTVRRGASGKAVDMFAGVLWSGAS